MVGIGKVSGSVFENAGCHVEAFGFVASSAGLFIARTAVEFAHTAAREPDLDSVETSDIEGGLRRRTAALTERDT
jgi:hypothetical protein